MPNYHSTACPDTRTVILGPCHRERVMFRNLCEQRRNIRNDLGSELTNHEGPVAGSFAERREGVAERACLIASNLEIRSTNRVTLNSEHQSTVYEKGLADSERVRAEATIEVHRFGADATAHGLVFRSNAILARSTCCAILLWFGLRI